MCLVLLTALIEYSMMSNSDFTFTTNNVREIQSFKKRTRLIEHFSIKNENVWVNDFTCPVLFFHVASNSWFVPIAYLGKKSLALNEQKTDKAGITLILDVMLQPWTRYMRQCLVFVCNSAIRENFNFYFSAVFCYYQRNFSLEGRLETRLQSHKVLRFS